MTKSNAHDQLARILGAFELARTVDARVHLNIHEISAELLALAAALEGAERYTPHRVDGRHVESVCIYRGSALLGFYHLLP